jgi:hypothetical protein
MKKATADERTLSLSRRFELSAALYNAIWAEIRAAEIAQMQRDCALVDVPELYGAEHINSIQVDFGDY